LLEILYFNVDLLQDKMLEKDVFEIKVLGIKEFEIE